MIVDTHFHMLATDPEPGCILSPKVQHSLAGLTASLLMGTFNNTLADLLHPKEGSHLKNPELRARLLEQIENSREVDGFVLLALDAMHREDGTRQQEQHMVTTNEYVAWVIREYGVSKRLYLGASVHPYRRDALDALEAAKALGAVLVKWIPSSQQIDPRHQKVQCFYEKLVELGLPLLCHTGWEGAVPVLGEDWRAFEDPRCLRPALDAGVTVIVAHCAAPYLPHQPNYVRHLRRMLGHAEARQWNLYADVSALLLAPRRAKTLRHFLSSVDPKRLLYGTDFPIPTHDLSCGQLGPARDLPLYLKAVRTKNLIDKDVRFKRAYGLPAAVFENTAAVLGLT
jgi:uncharacterized protein